MVVRRQLPRSLTLWYLMQQTGGEVDRRAVDAFEKQIRGYDKRQLQRLSRAFEEGLALFDDVVLIDPRTMAPFAEEDVVSARVACLARTQGGVRELLDTEGPWLIPWRVDFAYRLPEIVSEKLAEASRPSRSPWRREWGVVTGVIHNESDLRHRRPAFSSAIRGYMQCLERPEAISAVDRSAVGFLRVQISPWPGERLRWIVGREGDGLGAELLFDPESALVRDEFLYGASTMEDGFVRIERAGRMTLPRPQGM